MLKIFAAVLFAACTSANSNQKKMEPIITEETVYSFKMPSIDGGEINFSDYKGKKILIVNTASECGYTPQYEGLEKLYEGHKEHLVVIGVPSNDFGQQEPGSNEEINKFCKSRFGVTFPLTAKTAVIGEKQDPLFRWLTTKTENGVLDAEVKWNFTKFLLDENGKLLASFPSKTDPMSEEILQYLK